MAKTKKPKQKEDKPKQTAVPQTKEKNQPDETSKAIRLLVIIGIAAFIFSYSLHYVSSQRERDELLDLMNKRCSILQGELMDIYGNYTVCMELYEDEARCNMTYSINCYYAQCPTNQALMDKTQPLCVCDFSTEQGEATFCIRTA